MTTPSPERTPPPSPAPAGRFRLLARDGAARRGELSLPHGKVQTPVFMPVGTQAAVKTLAHEEVEALGYEIVLGNTYHLFLRPGIDALEAAGGLHAFMGWTRNILTDSGGYQVFSLAHRRKVEEEGVTFASHVDGARRLLTPEIVTRAQLRMGVDVAMCLDECPPYPVSEAIAREMMERTLRWAGRCRGEWEKISGDPRRTALYPIVQGSTFPELRKESARRTVELDLPGYAIGGLSVGEPRELLGPMIEASAAELPEDKPRYLMGVGKPQDVLTAVERGVDMMDCVFPTRNGRNGQALTWSGPLNLRNARCREDSAPLDPDCACPACRRYSRRYIAHLFRAGEILALRLVSLHNLAFMVDFLRKIRDSIEQSNFRDFKSRFLQKYSENTDL
jgi:queuine tRNA-ribosyltransferase